MSAIIRQVPCHFGCLEVKVKNRFVNGMVHYSFKICYIANLKTLWFYLFLLLSLGYSSGCSEYKSQISIEGIYSIDVTVIERPTVQYSRGEYIVTKPGLNCHRGSNSEGCPLEYSITNVEIYSVDNKFFIKNELVRLESDSSVSLSDIPLEKTETGYKLKGDGGTEILYGIASYKALKAILLEFRIDILDNGELKGEWKIIDLNTFRLRYTSDTELLQEYSELSLSRL